MTNHSHIKQSLVNAMDKFAKDLWGRTLTDSLHEHTCVRCGENVAIFRDDTSAKEYQICGFCQDCQDKYAHITD